ncbi:unnamed protein product [Clavelina lepadiformis]|uniref:Uncharacterized protein n=1 Tax=Clavelina lepadiformis TaxID=159417 RepID=A0ABP0EZG9_CLALP
MNLKLVFCLLLVSTLLLPSDAFWGRRRRRWRVRLGGVARKGCAILGVWKPGLRAGCHLISKIGDENLIKLKEFRQQVPISLILLLGDLFREFTIVITYVLHQDLDKYEEAMQQIADELSDEIDPQEVTDGLEELDQVFAEKSDYSDSLSKDVNSDADILDLLNDDDDATEQ